MIKNRSDFYAIRLRIFSYAILGVLKKQSQFDVSYNSIRLYN